MSFINKANTMLVVCLLSVQFCPSIHAQDDSNSAPVPGSQINAVVASEKNAELTASQNVSISPLTNSENSLSVFAFNDLPVSIKGLSIWLSKFKQEAKESAIKEDKLNPLIVWIDGLIKAHCKLANVFAKYDNLKSDYENECTLLRQLRQIKNEFLYLKAQILIKDKKLKQAIPMLIEIVSTEPNSSLGRTAYEHLKFSGFSTADESVQSIQSLQDKTAKNKQSATIKN